MPRPLAASLLAGVIALAGCVHVHEQDHAQAKRHGPPPHAPAHGYRHHQRDVDLRYDGHLGVYVVIGHPHHFFHEGHYYRRVASHWERCGSWKKADWNRVEAGVVPVTLAGHYKRNGPKYGKARGQGPAKHDD